jgi:UrcA family protein
MICKMANRPLGRVFGLIGAFVGANLFFGNVLAADVDIPPRQVVRFADLNLDRPEGVATLYARLRIAATKVCDDGEPDWVVRRLSNACALHATERAIADINLPALTSYHQQH